MGRLFYFTPVLSSFFLTYSQLLHIACVPYFRTGCGFNVHLKCRCNMCCMWLAENKHAEHCQKFAMCAPLQNVAGLYLCN